MRRVWAIPHQGTTKKLHLHNHAVAAVGERGSKLSATAATVAGTAPSIAQALVSGADAMAAAEKGNGTAGPKARSFLPQLRFGEGVIISNLKLKRKRRNPTHAQIRPHARQ